MRDSVRRKIDDLIQGCLYEVVYNDGSDLACKFIGCFDNLLKQDGRWFLILKTKKVTHMVPTLDLEGIRLCTN